MKRIYRDGEWTIALADYEALMMDVERLTEERRQLLDAAAIHVRERKVMCVKIAEAEAKVKRLREHVERACRPWLKLAREVAP